MIDIYQLRCKGFSRPTQTCQLPLHGYAYLSSVLFLYFFLSFPCFHLCVFLSLLYCTHLYSHHARDPFFKYSRFLVHLGYDHPFSVQPWYNWQLHMPLLLYSSPSQSRVHIVPPILVAAAAVVVLVAVAAAVVVVVVVGVVSRVEPVLRYWHPSWRTMPLSRRGARLIKT
jgi:hypothetical protein